MEHIKLTKEGFTHWSSGPGNPTFDPECGACWETEVERLKTEPQACNSGHKRWPITLWDCPDCVVTRLAEKDTTIATLRKALEETTLMFHRGYLHKTPLDRCSVGQCAINRHLLDLATKGEE